MASGNWRKVTTLLIPGTKTTLTAVEEGQQYRFRVSAVNDAGPGKFCKASEVVTIKDPTCMISALYL